MEDRSSQPSVEGSTGPTPGGQTLPPGPRERFDIEALDRPLETMSELHREHGDIYSVHSPIRERVAVVVIHPEHVKRVLIDNRENYRKGVGFQRVRMLLGNGIIVSDGPFWRRQRRMVQPAFRRERIAAYARWFGRIGERLLESWRDKARRGESADVTGDTSLFALDCVLHALLGEDVERLSERNGRNPFMIVAEDSARNLDFARRFRRLGKLVVELAAERRARDETRIDILDSIIAARDAETGEPMDDTQIVDEILTLIIAGHETTASTLNWCWYLLSRHPEAETRLHDEVDRELPAAGPSVEDLPRLAYTGQVLEETMRLYPPVWRFTRRAVEDDEIGGYRIPAGSDVCICPYLTHRHPEFWETPEEFRPERFDEQGKAERHRLAFLPFSAGPRRCIGDWMAMVEMQIHLAGVARELTLARTSHAPVEMLPEINLRSRSNIHMTPALRRSEAAR